MGRQTKEKQRQQIDVHSKLFDCIKGPIGQKCVGPEKSCANQLLSEKLQITWKACAAEVLRTQRVTIL